MLEYHSLENYIEEKYRKASNNYVLIDEIQMCEHFEKAINSLYAKEKYDISDSKTFDREITPLLRVGDAYPKMIIARTYQPEYQHEGVRIIDAAEWLSK